MSGSDDEFSNSNYHELVQNENKGKSPFQPFYILGNSKYQKTIFAPEDLGYSQKMEQRILLVQMVNFFVMVRPLYKGYYARSA